MSIFGIIEFVYGRVIVAFIVFWGMLAELRLEKNSFLNSHAHKHSDKGFCQREEHVIRDNGQNGKIHS